MDLLKESIDKLDKWIDSNGWAGYDPYDLFETNLYLKFQYTRYSRRILEELIFNQFPYLCRKVLGVKKQIFAKAMGLFAAAYLDLYQVSENKRYLTKALECLDWLLEHHSKGYSGYCWGYPFDWYTRILIPKGMPSGVVTSFVLDGFRNAFEILKDDSYFKIIESACEFFINDLNIDYISKDELCFSYTPIDRFHVHNANLLIAKHLFYVGTINQNRKYIYIAEKALNYTLNAQNDDGSWYYWGNPDKIIFMIDNHHTGFNLQSLYNIYELTKSNIILDSIKKGLDYYISNFISERYIPSLYPKDYNHVVINACAEIIICLAILSQDFPECLELAQKIAEWTISQMQDNRKGFFYYRIYHGLRSKISYIRTGQAWMLRALVYLRIFKNLEET